MIIAANAQDIIKFPFLQTTLEYSAYHLWNDKFLH